MSVPPVASPSPKCSPAQVTYSQGKRKLLFYRDATKKKKHKLKTENRSKVTKLLKWLNCYKLQDILQNGLHQGPAGPMRLSASSC